MSLSRRQFSVGTALLLSGVGQSIALADGDPAATETALASKLVDTSKFKKPGPYKIGVSAGYLSNSWSVYNKQYILWAADQNKKDVSGVVTTDAGFNPTKQVSDVEDLLRQKIDLLLYWAVDEKSLGATLKKAVDAGIPTVNAFGGFSEAPGTVSNAYISQLMLSQMVAQHLMESIGGKGEIVAILPIAGTQEASDQLVGLRYVLKKNPSVKLLNVSYGDYNRAKAKQITENLLQRYPRISGIFSPSGNMDIGVAEAVEEAGRLDDVKMSPGDELNGWLKWVIAHKQSGAVTFPPIVGQVAVDLGLKILKGQAVPRGQRIPSVYISPSKAASIYDAKASDDSWPGPLPAEFRPK